MVRAFLTVMLIGGCLRSQEPPAPPAVITVDVAPLAPPDLGSAYASPRDAARHRFQATMSQLQSSRNIRAAMQGFAEAFAADRTYAAAAFNLGVIAAIAEKWEDALAALEESARLDPAGLGRQAAPSIERLRRICALEAAPEGKLQRRYDEALFPVLQNLPKLPPADAMQALAEAGRIDPKRWEAPALMAALSGIGHGYDVASKFLEIAVANAPDAQLKERLQKALDAARRELRYDAARAAADAAADRAEFEKAGSLYEDAWAVIPARSSNGMEAASAWLLHDDTARASTLLIRLRESGDPELAPLAGAMLKELTPIEPAAKAAAPDARDFFRDAGSTQPVVLSDIIPPVNTGNMELLARPLPKLVQDAEAVVLLASLSAAPDPAAAALPELPASRIAGENPWREVQQLLASRPAEGAAPQAERPVSTAEIGGGKVRRPLQVTSRPAGALIFAGDAADPACETPCTIHAAPGSYSLRMVLPGYREEVREIRVAAKSAELDVPLDLIRGNILIEAPGAGSLKVNGTSIAGQQTSVELALAPGLYRISAEFGQTVRERTLNLKPGARLRLELRP
ncbi:MAG TPA: PEGA domain-containing protein [Candidatus Acidoferrales bacterium]|nr:PEGA domain-containing protein [Candidatus Acidoferrales bacterium]